MENVATVAESMCFTQFSFFPRLISLQAKWHWHQLYINFREWIFFTPLHFFIFFPLSQSLYVSLSLSLCLFLSLFLSLSLPSLSLPVTTDGHCDTLGSVRNERYSCRHAMLVMKSCLDLLHDWFCNLVFSGFAQNVMMSCWTCFKYP